MFQVVKIGDKEVPMLAMASVDILYKQIFKKDAIKIQANPEVDSGDIIDLMLEMGFVMAKNAEFKDRKKMLKLNEDAYLDWLDGFERNELLEALEDIRATYEGQKISTSKEKKEEEQ